VICQKDQQQCTSGPVLTECARTARKRTIGALVFLRLSENLEENLDSKFFWATLPHRLETVPRFFRTYPGGFQIDDSTSEMAVLGHIRPRFSTVSTLSVSMAYSYF